MMRFVLLFLLHYQTTSMYIYIYIIDQVNGWLEKTIKRKWALLHMTNDK